MTPEFGRMPAGRGRVSSGRLKTLAVLVSCAGLWLWAGPAYPQAIDPDRPDLTTSAGVVGSGVLQIESGLEYEQARVGGQPMEKRFTVQATLRAGLASTLEASLEGQPFVWQKAGEEDSGSGDYTLGFKYRFLAPSAEGAGPMLTVKPYVKLPTASEPIGSGRPDFGALLLMTLGLPWGLSLDANAGVAAIGQTRPNGFIPQGIVGASLSWTPTERLSTVSELYFTTKDERDGRESLRTTLAIIYRVTPNLALDSGVRTTLVGTGPDWSVLAGLSVRFGR